MQRLEKVFSACRAEGRTALVAYLTGGYPSLVETAVLVEAVHTAGADVIELGVPFSDPLGDGPVIQATAQAALAGGATVASVLEVVQSVRGNGIDVPIVLMGYCNPFLRYGLDQLYSDARRAGVDGFVVPDLPAHEADEWVQAAVEHDLGQAFFTAPGSGPQRLRESARRSRGFLYAVSSNGVTGVRDDLDDGIEAYLQRVRAAAGKLPVAVGFGISRPDQVAALSGRVDGVIVGSALLTAIGSATGVPGRLTAASNLIESLREAC